MRIDHGYVHVLKKSNHDRIKLVELVFIADVVPAFREGHCLDVVGCGIELVSGFDVFISALDKAVDFLYQSLAPSGLVRRGQLYEIPVHGHPEEHRKASVLGHDKAVLYVQSVFRYGTQDAQFPVGLLAELGSRPLGQLFDHVVVGKELRLPL